MTESKRIWKEDVEETKKLIFAQLKKKTFQHFSIQKNPKLDDMYR